MVLWVISLMITCMLPFIGMIVFGFAMSHKFAYVLSRNSHNSVVGEAKIIGKKKVYYSKKKRGFFRVVHDWAYTYEYYVNGRRYTRTCFATHFDFNLGVVVQVFIDPDNPEKSVLRAEQTKWMNQVRITGKLVGIFVTVMLILSILIMLALVVSVG